MFLTKLALDKIEDDLPFDIIATCDHVLKDISVYPPVEKESIKQGSVWRVTKRWNNSIKSYILTEALQGAGHWRFPLHVYDDTGYGFSIVQPCDACR